MIDIWIAVGMSSVALIVGVGIGMLADLNLEKKMLQEVHDEAYKQYLADIADIERMRKHED